MPRAIVTLDDGTQVEVTFDDDATAPQSAIGPERGVPQAALQGAALEFGDELTGTLVGGAVAAPELGGLTPTNPFERALRFAGAVGGTRGDVIDAERANLASFREANPITAGAAQVGGALLTAPFAGALPANTFAQGAGAAAGIGGIAGAGAGEGGVLDRAGGAGAGAALGGFAGGAVKLAGIGFSRLKERIFPRLTDRLAALIEAQNLTPQQIKTRLQALGPKATLADVNRVFGSAADSAASRIGPTQRRVAELIRRDETQFSRILEPIKRSLGGAAQRATNISELKTVQEEIAAPLYDEARRAGVQMTPRLQNLLKDRRFVSSAWRKVKDLADNDPDLARQQFISADGKTPSIDGWRRITAQLNQMIGTKLRRASPDREGAGVITRLRNAINDELDAQNPAYAQARRTWAGTKAADEMIAEGEKIFKLSSDELAPFLAELSEADKIFFRVGAGRAIENKLSRASDNADVTRIFRNEDFRRKALALFPDADSAADFMNTVQAEAIKKSTSNTLGRGSQTAQRLAADAQLGGGAISTADVSTRGVLGRAAGRLGAKSRENVKQQIGLLLTSQDPAQQEAAIKLMIRAALDPRDFGVAPAAIANIFGARAQ